MLKMASTHLGISPKQASIYAQDLYIRGFISYPRTGTTKYSPNFNFKKSLEMFKGPRDYYFYSSKNIQELINNFNRREFNFYKGKEKGGHQPIFPTKYGNINLEEEKKELLYLSR